MANSFDLKTILTLVNALTPKAIAPVLPLEHDFTVNTQGAFGMAKDIQYLKEGQARIETKLEKITETHVTQVDFNDHCVGQNKLLSDYETRLRTNTDGIKTVDGKVDVMRGQFKTVVWAVGIIVTFIQIAVVIAAKLIK